MREITEEEFNERMNNEGFRSVCYGYGMGMSGFGNEGDVLVVSRKYFYFENEEYGSVEYKNCTNEQYAEHMAFVTQEFAHGILVQW